MTREITIMVVDDDPDIQTVLRGNLQLAGYRVVSCLNGREAFAALARELPELLILDLSLPDHDGIQVCRRLRSEYGEGLPIIMLTARDGLADKVLGFECGADDYVVKPFAFLELLARIKSCLRRRGTAAGDAPVEPLSFGGLLIDYRLKQARVDQRDAGLTHKEFKLLALLAENRDRVLSREDIRRALWGNRELYSWSRAIDVHIRHLRCKIETDPENPRYIQTVVGVGYRFVA
ncbi:MAG TPA: response regulator transcription factor [Proteobacteria bacterium]|nr:response regulator transcription factor [Pseudomonadota bacterium]